MRLRVVVAIAVGIALATPARASEPGQPLDCTDFVALQPGYSCRTLISDFAGTGLWDVWASLAPAASNGSSEADNEDRLLGIRIATGPPTDCAPGVPGGHRIEVVAFDGTQENVIGFFANRCGVYGTEDEIHNKSTPRFLQGRGALYWPLQSTCYRWEVLNGPPCSYEGRVWIALIEGFSTTFEILQSYTPTAGPISFRVPYMPEGFQYADYFDTYWGDLSTVGDWSQAQPLQCGYPASAPSVGDYLTVEDTLPSPAPGHGYYYVTAVNYQGQRRYGRQSNGGVLTGRDPAVLPGCE